MFYSRKYLFWSADAAEKINKNVCRLKTGIILLIYNNKKISLYNCLIVCQVPRLIKLIKKCEVYLFWMRDRFMAFSKIGKWIVKYFI